MRVNGTRMKYHREVQNVVIAMFANHQEWRLDKCGSQYEYGKFISEICNIMLHDVEEALSSGLITAEIS